jgi:hypothetical protein
MGLYDLPASFNLKRGLVQADVQNIVLKKSPKGR